MFGRSDSPDEVWQEFYNFFSAYVTTRSYSWLDKYDVRGENRRIQRLAEKENKKFRDPAKKERNELVRTLVLSIKKRDKRFQAFNAGTLIIFRSIRLMDSFSTIFNVIYEWLNGRLKLSDSQFEFLNSVI